MANNLAPSNSTLSITLVVQVQQKQLLTWTCPEKYLKNGLVQSTNSDDFSQKTKSLDIIGMKRKNDKDQNEDLKNQCTTGQIVFFYEIQ